MVTCGQTVYEPSFEYQHGVLKSILQLELFKNITTSDLASLTNKLKDLLHVIENLNSTTEALKATKPTGGSTYTRWGKTTCPEGDSVMVYDGWVGGSSYSNSGGGSNQLCLPKDPKWPTFYNNIIDHKSSVYGTEYEIGGEHQNHEVPCAVCWIPRSSNFMLPGRNECYDGWKLEYRGILVAEHNLHPRTEYVCLDERIGRSNESSSNNDNGNLFYIVEARCGSLPCETYKNGRELSCAVCSYSPFANTQTIQPYA
ncbi:hypothetical protein ACF0H5_001641 [Mactra antiquata]